MKTITPDALPESVQPTDAPRGFKAKAAARYLGVSVDFVRAEKRAGRLPYARLGVALVFLKEDLDAYLNARRAA